MPIYEEKLSKKTENKDKIRQVVSYLRTQSSIDTLRFITCGSVDDGKSTLIGRMLYEAHMIFEDQIQLLKKDSKKKNIQDDTIDFSLLVDGLAAEREQGITIDVAYRFFSTEKRKFIVADTPGHEQYTRNMVTGASNAEVAIILINANKGVLDQTRRHSVICSVLGIKNIILAINKMDNVEYKEITFNKIVENYISFSKQLDFDNITAIPVSALKGDNVVDRSNNTKWYNGPTLLGMLEIIDAQVQKKNQPFRFPVQMVNRSVSNFRGYMGTLASGELNKGQEIKVLPSGEKAKIKDIILYKKSLQSAVVGQSITITVNREIDISRGDVIVSATEPCELSDQFQLKLFWMENEPGYVGRSYLMKIGTMLVNAQITQIKHKISINTFEYLSVSKLEFNELYLITIKTDRLIPYEKYKICPDLGGLILIDRISNQTVAVGMIEFALRRAKNLHLQKMDIDKKARQKMNGYKSKVLWFTGLSGSGKSTISNAIEIALFKKGMHTYILDGDNIRHGLNKDLGFSNADRIENIRRIAEVAKLMVDAGIFVITSFISPFKVERQMARNMFESDEFIEIYIDVPLDIAEARDPKGLYAKARKGELKNFTGLDSPYEPPENPEIKIDTVNNSIEEIVKQILSVLKFK